MKAEPFSIVDEGIKIGLICLNSRFEPIEHIFNTLFSKACISIFVDGFANTIFDSSFRDTHIPSFVTGDFDSIRPEVKSFYQSKTTVVETPDQDATDFTKAFLVLMDDLNVGRNVETAHHTEPCLDYIVCLYGSGGRADHEFGIVKTLFIATKLTNIPLLLVTESSISFLLEKGNNTIDVSKHPSDLYCGLIPVGRPVRVTSTGLRWNLNDDVLDFEGLVSTSNRTVNGIIHVDCDGPLLWSISNYLCQH